MKLCMSLIFLGAFALCQADPLTNWYVCVQTASTTSNLSCNLTGQGMFNGTAPLNVSGTYGPLGTQETVDLSATASYGYLRASASGSLDLSGGTAAAYALSGADFSDTLTISDTALTGQTGYLEVGYTLDGTISSSGIDQGSFLAIGDVGSNYSSNVYTSSVDGNFVLPETFTFIYGQPFAFQLALYPAVGTGTWKAIPSSRFGFGYDFSLANGRGSASANASDTLALSLLQVQDANGNPVAGVNFSSASGTAYGTTGVVPEPSSYVILSLVFAIFATSGWLRHRVTRRV